MASGRNGSVTLLVIAVLLLIAGLLLDLPWGLALLGAAALLFLVVIVTRSPGRPGRP